MANPQVKKIRAARARFDQIFEVSKASELPEVRAAACLMNKATLDIIYEFIEFYRKRLSTAIMDGGDFEDEFYKLTAGTESMLESDSW